MAKYSQASEEVENLVNEISNEIGLFNYGVDFQPLFVNKSKEVCKVVKANEMSEYVSKREDLVFVVCNEVAFEGTDPQGHPYVDEKTKYLWLRTEMEKVGYDTEKDKLIIGCPSITLPVGLYEKYKDEGKDQVLIQNALLGQYTLAKIEQDRKEEAERKKALKTKKKKGGE
jgi:hypothetical protein